MKANRPGSAVMLCSKPLTQVFEVSSPPQQSDATVCRAVECPLKQLCAFFIVFEQRNCHFLRLLRLSGFKRSLLSRTAAKRMARTKERVKDKGTRGFWFALRSRLSFVLTFRHAPQSEEDKGSKCKMTKYERISSSHRG